ncbi:ATP-dependent DNA helicase [Trichonephila clavipes]|nr:ATP-dependent DNA helicase [Trichonephila clavipes]
MSASARARASQKYKSRLSLERGGYGPHTGTPMSGAERARRFRERRKADAATQSRRIGTMAREVLQNYRSTFIGVKCIIIGEVSMIGCDVLHKINLRLQEIPGVHDQPFGNLNIIFCGDLHQLPPVNASPVYKGPRNSICGPVLWQSLDYYPLEQVMRQSDSTFSEILTKIGNGERLGSEQIALIESRFRSRAWCKKLGGKFSHLNFKLDIIDRLIERHGSVNERKRRPGILPNPSRLTERHISEMITPTVKKLRQQDNECSVCCSKRNRFGKRDRQNTGDRIAEWGKSSMQAARMEGYIFPFERGGNRNVATAVSMIRGPQAAGAPKCSLAKKKRVYKRLKTSEVFRLQLDESTNIEGHVVLLVREVCIMNANRRTFDESSGAGDGIFKAIDKKEAEKRFGMEQVWIFTAKEGLQW